MKYALALILLLSAGCAGRAKPPAPPPAPMTADEARTAADAERATREVRVEEVRTEDAVDLAGRGMRNRQDYDRTVQRWTGWMIGGLTLMAFIQAAALVLRFIPALAFLSIVSARSLGYTLGLIAAMGVGRWALLAYGMVAMHFLFWGGVVAGILAAAPFVVAWVKLTLLRTSSKLKAGGHTDAAVAMQAQAFGITGETAIDKTKRRKMLAAAKGEA